MIWDDETTWLVRFDPTAASCLAISLFIVQDSDLYIATGLTVSLM